jgi:hypothetical protein
MHFGQIINFLTVKMVRFCNAASLLRELLTLCYSKCNPETAAAVSPGSQPPPQPSKSKSAF